ncbi:tetratricopeptide repeat (TPR)-like superfamily protein [Artemisia annua]|uniref:Tetratricopeptide repeat (TPR)-like superfamily protein n=1 Tax=Artemisia annua TaxID=35608 RepID=A0A2U1NC15_ARTAN|nr:tetratricopeptide repeat (TPR)-like superfamily protein [Artemisia annua]
MEDWSEQKRGLHLLKHLIGCSRKDVYSELGIKQIFDIEIEEPYGWKSVKNITVLREDDNVYEYTEVDFQNMNMNDLEYFNGLKRLIAIEDIHKFYTSTLKRVYYEIKAILLKNKDHNVNPPMLATQVVELGKIKDEVEKKLGLESTSPVANALKVGFLSFFFLECFLEGSDTASGPVWTEYINFLKSSHAQNPQEESRRMLAVKKYAKELMSPLHIMLNNTVEPWSAC